MVFSLWLTNVLKVASVTLQCHFNFISMSVTIQCHPFSGCQVDNQTEEEAFLSKEFWGKTHFFPIYFQILLPQTIPATVLKFQTPLNHLFSARFPSPSPSPSPPPLSFSYVTCFYPVDLISYCSSPSCKV